MAISVNGAKALFMLPDGSTHEIDVGSNTGLGAIGAALPQVAIVGHDLKRTFKLIGEHLETEPTRLFDTGIAARLLSGGRPIESAGAASGPALRAHAVDLHHRLWVQGLEEISALEHAILPAVVEMELTGVSVDEQRWRSLLATRRARALQLKRVIEAQLAIPNATVDDTIRSELSVMLGVELPATDGGTLAPYMHVEVVKNIVRFRQISSFVNDVGQIVLVALNRDRDGRVRARVDQLGCETGRFTTSDPNLLGMPRDQEVRECIAAPAGRKLVIADYSTLELRVLAEVSGDKALRDVFRQGGDPHRATAAVMLGKAEPDVTAEERQRAKPVNFGCVFGSGPNGIVAQALKNFGIQITVEEAEQFRSKFFGAYPAVADWQNQVKSEAPTVVRTLGGRLRYLDGGPEQFNARLASVVQGTAADGVKQAIALLYPELKKFGAQLLLVVHDEFLVEVPENHAAALMTVVERAMIEGMARYVRSVPVTVKAKICRTWAEA